MYMDRVLKLVTSLVRGFTLMVFEKLDLVLSNPACEFHSKRHGRKLLSECVGRTCVPHVEHLRRYVHHMPLMQWSARTKRVLQRRREFMKGGGTNPTR